MGKRGEGTQKQESKKIFLIFLKSCLRAGNKWWEGNDISFPTWISSFKLFWDCRIQWKCLKNTFNIFIMQLMRLLPTDKLDNFVTLIRSTCVDYKLWKLHSLMPFTFSQHRKSLKRKRPLAELRLPGLQVFLSVGSPISIYGGTTQPTPTAPSSRIACRFPWAHISQHTNLSAFKNMPWS